MIRQIRQTFPLYGISKRLKVACWLAICHKSIAIHKVLPTLQCTANCFYLYHKHLYRCGGGGCWGAWSGGLQCSTTIFIVICLIEAFSVSHTILQLSLPSRYIINQYFQQGTVCTSKPVALNGHQTICECLKASETSLSRADPSIMQCLPVVLWKLVSILMELLVGSESYSLPLCVYVCMGVCVCVCVCVWQI